MQAACSLTPRPTATSCYDKLDLQQRTSMVQIPPLISRRHFFVVLLSSFVTCAITWLFLFFHYAAAGRTPVGNECDWTPCLNNHSSVAVISDYQALSMALLVRLGAVVILAAACVEPKHGFVFRSQRATSTSTFKIVRVPDTPDFSRSDYIVFGATSIIFLAVNFLLGGQVVSFVAEHPALRK